MANAKTCLVCNETEGKYKCGRCNLYTCSLPCFREHRDSHPPIEESPTTVQTNSAPAVSTDDTKLDSNLQNSSHAEDGSPQSTDFKRSEIADMPEYKMLIRRYPNLERLLWNIAAATDPPTSNDGTNNKLLGSNRGNRKANQPWTKDIGYENGVEALRRTRETPGDDRDALREYCELVQLYLSKKAAADTRQQLAQDDAKTIGELMRAEGSDAR
ncbi:uncharacterized protein F4822DRAFT_240874 [Hypoxylon trugodes]|uniref:uncharacterized protein n=1 Tax=Hypoxylon trugodes TaxID=326681 RepID=UPI002195DB86|nr:uncharacterized protein F4822DRAFT_240874 [Hypoxylon trugodes]KAI1388291.1 hypothetical protein F4822DRAFT_240874 [Hypoxylon trugodes]